MIQSTPERCDSRRQRYFLEASGRLLPVVQPLRHKLPCRSFCQLTGVFPFSWGLWGQNFGKKSRLLASNNTLPPTQLWQLECSDMACESLFTSLLVAQRRRLRHALFPINTIAGHSPWSNKLCNRAQGSWKRCFTISREHRAFGHVKHLRWAILLPVFYRDANFNILPIE